MYISNFMFYVKYQCMGVPLPRSKSDSPHTQHNHVYVLLPWCHFSILYQILFIKLPHSFSGCKCQLSTGSVCSSVVELLPLAYHTDGVGSIPTAARAVFMGWRGFNPRSGRQRHKRA